MPTFRRPKNHENPFTRISNDVLRDPDLSYKAKGLLAYILSQVDDWEVYQEQLAEVGPDGTTAVRSVLQELRDAGYLERKEKRGDDGTYSGYEYIVYEHSDPEMRFSQSGDPDSGPSRSRKPPTNNKEKQEQRKERTTQGNPRARDFTLDADPDAEEDPEDVEGGPPPERRPGPREKVPEGFTIVREGPLQPWDWFYVEEDEAWRQVQSYGVEESRLRKMKAETREVEFYRPLDRHPAIEMHREFLGSEASRNALVKQKIVHNVRDLDVWEDVLETWSLNSYRKRSVKKQLNMYREKKVETRRDGGGDDGGDGGGSHPADDWVRY